MNTTDQRTKVNTMELHNATQELLKNAPQTAASLALATGASTTAAERALDQAVRDGIATVEDGDPPVVFDAKTPGWKPGREAELVDALNKAAVKARATGLSILAERLGDEVVVWGVPPGHIVETALDTAYEHVMGA